MFYRSSISVLAFLAAASMMLAGASAQMPEASKYPDWSGQWRAFGGGRFDPLKPPGRGQQAPLTPEYQKIFDEGQDDLYAGGQGNNLRVMCQPQGMPRQMSVIWGMEILIHPTTTYVLFENIMPRRIYTDGRDFPKDMEPAYAGFSIGKWLDTDGDGRFDTLEAETRNFKGPRTFETSGIPLHKDNATVIKERIYLDKSKPDTLLNQVTVIDNALTRPWTVTKIYNRQKDPVWVESICNEGNNYVMVDKGLYYLSADGYLMPTKKEQPPPDLRFFPWAPK